MKFKPALSIITHMAHLNYVGPSLHCMARPRAADGGYDLQIWKVAGNIE
jgi:hypothetical protein